MNAHTDTLSIVEIKWLLKSTEFHKGSCDDGWLAIFFCFRNLLRKCLKNEAKKKNREYNCSTYKCLLCVVVVVAIKIFCFVYFWLIFRIFLTFSNLLIYLVEFFSSSLIKTKSIVCCYYLFFTFFFFFFILYTNLRSYCKNVCVCVFMCLFVCNFSIFFTVFFFLKKILQKQKIRAKKIKYI